jgi:hypothetical protein
MPKHESSDDEIERWRALSEAQAAFDAQEPGRSFAGPLFQAAAHEGLEALREQFEAGDRTALLEAVHRCAWHELTIPEWATVAFMAAYREVAHARAASWDDVFGKPWPGKHLARLRRRRELIFPVRARIQELRQRSDPPPLDEKLFESVGKEFGIGKTVCQEFYYGPRKRSREKREISGNTTE